LVYDAVCHNSLQAWISSLLQESLADGSVLNEELIKTLRTALFFQPNATLTGDHEPPTKDTAFLGCCALMQTRKLTV